MMVVYGQRTSPRTTRNPLTFFSNLGENVQVSSDSASDKVDARPHNETSDLLR